MAEPLRLGIIGCRRATGRLHLPALRGLAELRAEQCAVGVEAS